MKQLRGARKGLIVSFSKASPKARLSGQAVFSEYVMILFIVIAVLTSLSIYVRRGLQARLHAARNYAIYLVNKNCDANCQNASGNVDYEYEPYYLQRDVSVLQNQASAQADARGTTMEGVQRKWLNTSTTVLYKGSQLPALCAGHGAPPCCRHTPPNC